MGFPSADLNAFLAARDFLLRHRLDYETAYRGFRWPDLTTFNWAFDYFDRSARENPKKTALWIVEEDGTEERYSWAEMSRRSSQVGNFLRRLGVERGSRIIVMLPNHIAIWEITLAALKIGAIIIPAATLLTTEDLRERIQRANARHVIAISTVVEKFRNLQSEFIGITVGDSSGITFVRVQDEFGARRGARGEIEKKRIGRTRAGIGCELGGFVVGVGVVSQAPWTLQAHSTHRILRPAKDYFRQNPPRGTSGRREERASHGRPTRQ